MPYRTFICLANSRKLDGRCVAGKDVTTHKWIRPVSHLETGELLPQHIHYQDGTIPNCLDIIRIEIVKSVPKYYQPENVLISDIQWIKEGTFPLSRLEELCDYGANFVTIEGGSDRISDSYLKKNKINSSLALIRPQALLIYKTYSFSRKPQLKAKFKYNGEDYHLVVTDPIIEGYDFSNNQFYKVTSKKTYLCVSLGEPFGVDCYKLVASIIFATKPHFISVDKLE